MINQTVQTSGMKTPAGAQQTANKLNKVDVDDTAKEGVQGEKSDFKKLMKRIDEEQKAPEDGVRQNQVHQKQAPEKQQAIPKLTLQLEKTVEKTEPSKQDNADITVTTFNTAQPDEMPNSNIVHDKPLSNIAVTPNSDMEKEKPVSNEVRDAAPQVEPKTAVLIMQQLNAYQENTIAHVKSTNFDTSGFTAKPLVGTKQDVELNTKIYKVKNTIGFIRSQENTAPKIDTIQDAAILENKTQIESGFNLQQTGQKQKLTRTALFETSENKIAQFNVPASTREPQSTSGAADTVNLIDNTTTRFAPAQNRTVQILELRSAIQEQVSKTLETEMRMLNIQSISTRAGYSPTATKAVTLQLQPVGLGRVHAQIAKTGDAMSVQLTVEKVETYDLFKQDIDALRVTLRTLGLGDVDINLQQQTSLQRQSEQETMNAHGNNNAFDNEMSERPEALDKDRMDDEAQSDQQENDETALNDIISNTNEPTQLII